MITVESTDDVVADLISTSGTEADITSAAAGVVGASVDGSAEGSTSSVGIATADLAASSGAATGAVASIGAVATTGDMDFTIVDTAGSGAITSVDRSYLIRHKYKYSTYIHSVIISFIVCYDICCLNNKTLIS